MTIQVANIYGWLKLSIIELVIIMTIKRFQRVSIVFLLSMDSSEHGYFEGKFEKQLTEFLEHCDSEVQKFRNSFKTPYSLDTHPKVVDFGQSVLPSFRPHTKPLPNGASDEVKFVHISVGLEDYINTHLHTEMLHFIRMLYIVEGSNLSHIYQQIIIISAEVNAVASLVFQQMNAYLNSIDASANVKATRGQIRFDYFLCYLVFKLILCAVSAEQALRDNYDLLQENEVIVGDMPDLLGQLAASFQFSDILSEVLFAYISDSYQDLVLNNSSWWLLFVFISMVHEDYPDAILNLNKILKVLDSRPPVLNLGFTNFNLREFMTSRLSSVKIKLLSDVSGFREEQLQEFDSDLQVVKKYEVFVRQWVSRMNTEVSRSTSQRDMLNTRITILIQGVELLQFLYNYVSNGVFEHLSLGVAIPSKAVVSKILKLFELCITIVMEFKKQQRFIERNLELYSLHILQSVYTNVGKLAVECEVANPSLLVPYLELVVGSSFLRGNAKALFNNVKVLMMKHDQLQNMYHIVSSVEKNLSLLVHQNKNLLEVYVQNINLNELNVKMVMSLINSLCKCENFGNTGNMEKYKDFIEESILQTLVKRLSSHIEQNLRLMVYKQQEDQYNKGEAAQSVELITVLEDVNYLIYGKFYFNLKREVEAKLSEAFYNFVSSNTKDWIIYRKMFLLANSYYNLKLVDFLMDIVPNTSAIQLIGKKGSNNDTDALNQEVSIDNLMEILLNKIPNHSGNTPEYSYSFIGNCFVQNFSFSNHLLVIKLNHITNIIRSNGYYEIKVIFNSLYTAQKELMTKLFELLYDDELQAALVKESRERTVMYFETEEDKSGLKNYDYSVLNRVVAAIGNVIGLIRLISLSCELYSLNQQKYHDVNDMQESTSLAKHEQQIYLESTKKSNRHDDYLKLLTKTLTSSLAANGSEKPKLYLVAPFMSIFQANSMIARRTEILKARKSNQIGNSCFVDDGFYVGMAYLLLLFDQFASFESLSLFEQAADNFKPPPAVKPSKSTDSFIGSILKLGSSSKTQDNNENYASLYKLHEYEVMKHVMFSTRLLTSDR